MNPAIRAGLPRILSKIVIRAVMVIFLLSLFKCIGDSCESLALIDEICDRTLGAVDKEALEKMLSKQ
jgi:hypothetical protein